MQKKMSFIKFSSMGPRGWTNFYRKQPKSVIRNVRKLWAFYLKSFIPSTIIKGYSSYVKFVIVGRSRTGSNLIRGSLMSHNHIIVFGDLFRRYNVRKHSGSIPWGLPFYPQTEKMVTLWQSEPIKFLEKEVFGKFPASITAVGFKVLYPHAYPESWRPIQEYLRTQKALKIIHIKRRNVLKTHLSLRRVGQRKDKWVNVSGVQEEKEAVFLDYDNCLKAFVDTRKWEQEQNDIYKDHDKIDVFYEDLSTDYEGEMKRIQAFLGVKCEDVKPLTYKQANQPLSRAISNYFELKEKFANTPWETYFED